jgi:hypothetical protein
MPKRTRRCKPPQPQPRRPLPSDADVPISIGEAARQTDITEYRLRRWVELGLVPAIRIGGERKVLLASLRQDLVNLL